MLANFFATVLKCSRAQHRISEVSICKRVKYITPLKGFMNESFCAQNHIMQFENVQYIVEYSHIAERQALCTVAKENSNLCAAVNVAVCVGRCCIHVLWDSR